MNPTGKPGSLKKQQLLVVRLCWMLEAGTRTETGKVNSTTESKSFIFSVNQDPHKIDSGEGQFSSFIITV